MKLYDKQPPFQCDISMEQFCAHYASSKTVSTESVELFLAKVKDSFSSVALKLDPVQDRFRMESESRRRATVVAAREVKFSNFRHEVVSKPESFSGYYTEYLKDFHPTAFALETMCSKLLDTLQLTLGTFINDYSDEKVTHIFGHIEYEKAKKILPSLQMSLSHYFKAPAAKVRSRVEDVLKSMQDFEVLYAQGDKVAQVLSISNVERMQKLVASTTDLVDALIQVNMGNGVLTRYEDSKKQLVDAIHLCAKYVELYHATLARWVFYSKSFNDLTASLEKFDLATSNAVAREV